MNFSPFTTQFAGIPPNAMNQFTTAKFAQNITTANGQVIGVVSGGDGGVQFLRSMESGATTAFTSGQVQGNNSTGNMTEPTLITLPITMPGSKPGEPQQTVHIQVINPNPVQQQTPKFQVGQMQIPIQSFQPGGTTVLTVAYSPQDGKFLPNHGFPEGMTVVAALQPQDLQLLAQAQAQVQAQAQAVEAGSINTLQQHQAVENDGNTTLTNSLTSNTVIPKEEIIEDDDKADNPSDQVTIKQESGWQSPLNQSMEFSDYITQSQTIPVNLQPFLKFNSAPNIVRYESDVTNTVAPTETEANKPSTTENENDSKPKKKRKAKKKPPKQKPPKPGQVVIATAIDGTTLFCCPECEMVYPEKENLEQHLTIHKIERRFICDICGAGLKRKEHLERHKSGHNPDRPYICSVCMKGFKRKEHLNLHFVIHSGEKNEICGECGKGFYRKDHLRKHANSHAAKRLKEEMNARASAASGTTSTTTSGNSKKDKSSGNNKSNSNNKNNSSQNRDGQNSNRMNSSNDILNSSSNNSSSNSNNSSICNNNNNNNTQQSSRLPTNTTAAISLSTVYVPTSDNTTLPVQIQIPQLVTTTMNDSNSTTTLVFPTAAAAAATQQSNSQDQQGATTIMTSQ